MTTYLSAAGQRVAEAQRALDEHPHPGTCDGPCRPCRSAGRVCPRPQALRILAELGVLPRRRRYQSLAGLRRVA
jgi:hypothetical protein